MGEAVTKIFYYIIAHKNPKQLKLLIDVLNNDSDIICIHVDEKYEIQHFKCFIPESKNIFYINKRIKVYWGGWSQVKVTIKGLKNFVESNCDYFVPLSAQDLPIKKITDFKVFLSEHASINFIDYINCLESWKGAQSRSNIFYFKDFFEGLRHRFIEFVSIINSFEGLLNKVQRFFCIHRSLPKPYILHGGSSWFIINKNAGKSILKEIAKNSKLVNYFKYTECADEHFFQTLISASNLVNSVNKNNLRFTKFLEGKNNPELVSAKEIFSLSNDHLFFARKFDLDYDSNSLFEIINYTRENHDM